MTNKLQELPQKTKLILGIFLIIIAFIGLLIFAFGIYKLNDSDISYIFITVGFIFLGVGLGVGTPLLYYYKQQNQNVDCVISWDNGSSCVDGKKTYNATIVTPKKNEGKDCGELTKITSCDNDCVLDWDNWSDCDKITGTRNRYSKIISPAYNNGKACPTPVEIAKNPIYKQTEFCAVDCELNTPVWIPTSDCSKTCGGGTQTFKRNVAYPPLNGGKDCMDSNGNLIPETKTDTCNTQGCPVDCVVSNWSYGNWSNCSLNCSGGTQTRTNTRSILTQPQNGGLACPVLIQTETQTCNTQPCFPDITKNYIIKNVATSNCLLNNNNNVIVGTGTCISTNNNQQWNFIYNGKDKSGFNRYLIKQKNSGKCLFNTQNGNQLTFADCDNTSENQLWKLNQVGTDKYALAGTYSTDRKIDQCLIHRLASATDNKVLTWDCPSPSNDYFAWQFVAV